jgi:Ca2+-transporting ATPase
MGGRGTQSARDIAAIVLLDDNFRTIVGAIGEGRQLFENLRRAFLYLLAIHIPFVLTATLVPLLGAPLLYLPIHIVWIEAIIHPVALLVFQDLPPTGPLGRVPARAAPGGAARFFSRREWAAIVGSGGLITLGVILAFARGLAAGESVETARAMALAALVAAGGTLTAGLSRLRTGAARLVTGLTVGVSVALIQTPWTAAALHLAPLPPWTLLSWMAIGVAAAGLPLVPTAGGTDHQRGAATSRR